MHYHELTETRSLRQVRIKDINLDDAQRHFDLPTEGQIAGSMSRALAASKAGLLQLFKGETVITIYRGFDIPVEELDIDHLGISWAWNPDGAIKGSGLGTANTTGILLTGIVDEAMVDWHLTIAVNAFHEDEQEVVLHHGVAVTIKTIHNVAGYQLGPDVTPAALKNQIAMS